MYIVCILHVSTRCNVAAGGRGLTKYPVCMLNVA